MHDRIASRAVEVANIVIKEKCTVRIAAERMGVSKSTIHKDLVERLPKINPKLAGEAIAIISLNKAERHMRGGIATKEKYLKGTV